jgi:hypothetical protein
VTSLGVGDLSRNGLESAVDDAKGATETLVTDLKELGTPDTEAGAEAKSAIDELSSELSKDVDEIQTALDDASGVSGVLTAVSTVSATLASMGTQLTSTFGDLESLDAKGELESALSQSSSCTELTGS